MHALDRLPAFPEGNALPDVSEPMLARDIGLRAASSDDAHFLHALFCALKYEELGLAHWPESLRQPFLDQQFALQHTQYVNAYPRADFLIVEHRNQPIGRYYLLRERPCYHIVDIALDPAWRGRGIGTLLLDWTQSQARRQSAGGISLQVDERNAGALHLYARLGFTETARETPYVSMRWANQAQLKTA